jgi:hypothetical protein
MKLLCSLVSFLSFSACFLNEVLAQDNYEIQVYPSEIVEEHHTMFELHSNYTLDGTKQVQDNMFMSNHLVHETLEITHGFSKWFEIGAYLFTAIGSDNRTGIAGTHLRPRFAIPEEYNLPIGISLSTEIGYQKLMFFPRQWLTELRPIIDKKINRFYFALNSTIDLSLDKNQHDGLQFNPCFKTNYEINKRVSLGLEYYGGLGPFKKFDPIQKQKHMLFGAIDLDFDPDWEFNAGMGYGLTTGTDKWIVKLILGRRLPI